MLKKRYLFFLAVGMLALGCAVVIMPSGGPKDTDPPKVISSKPANQSANFIAGNIEIEFDEFITLKDLLGNFIVSPPLEKDPEVMVKGKTLLIKLRDPLPPNTTFNFNFGEAITDFHEGNAFSNFQFVVSTGAFVDSLRISGIVTDALTREPAPDVWVMLYACGEYGLCDSLPYKEQPRYLTKTAKTGTFTIENIKEGTYKVFALVDKNRNRLFDLPNESIGFIGKTVSAGDSNALEITLFDQETREQKISKAWASEKGLVRIAFKLPAKEPVVRALNYTSKKAWETIGYSPSRDTLLYWNSSGADTLKVHISDAGYDFNDTLSVKLKQQGEYARLKVSANVSKTQTLDIGQALTIHASKPLVRFNKEGIRLFERVDSATYNTVPAGVHFADGSNRVIATTCEFKPGTGYKLNLEQGALHDFFQGENDSMKLEFSVRQKDYYGSVAVNVTFPDAVHPFIIQLLNPQGKVSREDIWQAGEYPGLSNRFEYPFLTPGKYRLKIIYDRNHNGQWDTGNYPEDLQPEKITFSKDQIVIRPNWDLVLDWELER